MFQLCTLASGSSGNCLVMTDGTTHLLVDAGISARRICKALAALDIAPQDLSGILVTHEHSDHIAGIATLVKQLALPLYASCGTARAISQRIPAAAPCLHTFSPGDSFSLAGLTVESFPTPHDAAESVGYAVSCGRRKAAVVTDLGAVTAAVSQGITGAGLLVVEANHDVQWLQSGNYPYYLKARILGDHGHLSNDCGGALARRAVEHGAKTVVLAHLSSENNTPLRAYDTVRACLTSGGIDPERDVLLEVAPRGEISRLYEVALC